jgi:hypothetical protein
VEELPRKVLVLPPPFLPWGGGDLEISWDIDKYPNLCLIYGKWLYVQGKRTHRKTECVRPLSVFWESRKGLKTREAGAGASMMGR